MVAEGSRTVMPSPQGVVLPALSMALAASAIEHRESCNRIALSVDPAVPVIGRSGHPREVSSWGPWQLMHSTIAEHAPCSSLPHVVQRAGLIRRAFGQRLQL